jgi:hypothetical protein
MFIKGAMPQDKSCLLGTLIRYLVVESARQRPILYSCYGQLKLKVENRAMCLQKQESELTLASLSTSSFSSILHKLGTQNNLIPLL